MCGHCEVWAIIVLSCSVVSFDPWTLLFSCDLVTDFSVVFGFLFLFVYNLL